MKTNLLVNIKKVHEDAVVPEYATPGSACFDLVSIHDGKVEYGDPGLFSTGLVFEVPVGHVMNIYSRSGHGFKEEIRLANCVGKIDSDYRGEVMVKLTSDGLHRGAFHVKAGDRIAQAEIVPIQQVEFEVVESISETERGEGGFGSTGA